MKADYKNWIPKRMATALGAGSVTLAAGAFASGSSRRGTLSRAFSAVCGLGAGKGKDDISLPIFLRHYWFEQVLILAKMNPLVS